MYSSQFVMLRPDPTASQKNPRPNKLTCGITNAEKGDVFNYSTKTTSTVVKSVLLEAFFFNLC